MREIIDLTYNIKEGMTTFGAPWHPPVEITQLGRHGFEGRETRKFTLGTHTGTHIDAPLHFVYGGKSIDSLPLKKLVGKVTIIDYSDLGKNEGVTMEMLENVSVSERMLFKFGWGKYWGNKKFYKDYPFFSKEAAEYLISNNVEMVAMDTPSPDDSRIKLSGEALGTEIDSPIHKIFLSNGVVLVEYIANLDKIFDYEGWNIVALPLKIEGADGSPARICIYR